MDNENKEKMDDELKEKIASTLADVLAHVTYQHVYLLCLEMGLHKKYPDMPKFLDIVAELSKAYVMNMFSFQEKLGDGLTTEEKVSRASTMADEVCKTSIRTMLFVN